MSVWYKFRQFTLFHLNFTVQMIKWKAKMCHWKRIIYSIHDTLFISYMILEYYSKNISHKNFSYEGLKWK